MLSPTQSLSQSLKHTSSFYRAWCQQQQVLWTLDPKVAASPLISAQGRSWLCTSRRHQKTQPRFFTWVNSTVSGLGSAAEECRHRLQGEELTHLPSPRVGTPPSQHPWGLGPLQSGRPPGTDLTMPKELISHQILWNTCPRFLRGSPGRDPKRS